MSKKTKSKINRNPQKSKKIQKSKKTKAPLIAALCAVVVLLLIAGYIAVCISLESDVIQENVAINGISVQGMTKSEALEAVTKNFEEDLSNYVVTVTLEGQEFPVDISSALGFDATSEVEDAYALGNGAWYLRPIERIEIARNELRELTVNPYLAYPEKLEELILATGIDAYDSVVNSSYEITDDALLVHKGKAGSRADIVQLEENIREAVETDVHTRTLECPFTTGQPEGIDFQAIYNEIYSESKEAEYDKSTGEIIPSSVGKSFDVEYANSLYETTEQGQDFTIDFTITEPTISTEDMEENLFSTTLSQYTTYGGGTSGRITNIKLASKACDGVILLPGEKFSYNDVVGKRTAERGFQMAGAYENGTVVQEIGGGICQVSSTIFAAVLSTNLEIVKRSNHSLPVSYMPLGMDATVSWGGPEFIFRNNRAYPIKLSVTYEGGAITVKIIGANENNNKVKVSLETVGDLSVNTYRETYDENGELISRVKVASSTYRRNEPTPTPTPEPTETPSGSSAEETPSEPAAEPAEPSAEEPAA